MLEIIKERFWRLVISCLYTYSMQRGTSPHGRQLCSQPEVSEAEGFRVAAGDAAAWTPPVGVKEEVHDKGLLEYANTSLSAVAVECARKIQDCHRLR